jgi:S1-C subfamily serine protease
VNWVDLLVVLLAVAGAASGARSGLVTALLSFLGVFLGAVVGLKLAPLLLARLQDQSLKLAGGIGVVVLLVACGQTFGLWMGHQLRDRIDSLRLTNVDTVLGAVLQAVAVLVVAWLVALPLTSASALPGMASAINTSRVLDAVNSVMPPPARAVPGELRRMLGASGFPPALEPFSSTPNAATAPPDPALASSAAVRDDQVSVVKVLGDAPSCGQTLEGSGFVIAPHRVLTNAHVVAGANHFSVEKAGGVLDATVVLYDPERDVAVLSVPGLDAAALPFGPSAASGDNVIALGYPLDGPYAASSARIRDRTNLRGPDIYDANTVSRDVYTIRGEIRSGNSGGPLIDPTGRVEGVVFAAAGDDPETGFVLTAQEVAPAVAPAASLAQPVPTGGCAN